MYCVVAVVAHDKHLMFYECLKMGGPHGTCDGGRGLMGGPYGTCDGGRGLMGGPYGTCDGGRGLMGGPYGACDGGRGLMCNSICIQCRKKRKRDIVPSLRTAKRVCSICTNPAKVQRSCIYSTCISN